MPKTLSAACTQKDRLPHAYCSLGVNKAPTFRRLHFQDSLTNTRCKKDVHGHQTTGLGRVLCCVWRTLHAPDTTIIESRPRPHPHSNTPNISYLRLQVPNLHAIPCSNNRPTFLFSGLLLANVKYIPARALNGHIPNVSALYLAVAPNPNRKRNNGFKQMPI